MNIGKGLELALEEGLDLVEISPNTDPPVCKILDYNTEPLQNHIDDVTRQYKDIIG